MQSPVRARSEEVLVGLLEADPHSYLNSDHSVCAAPAVRGT